MLMPGLRLFITAIVEKMPFEISKIYGQAMSAPIIVQAMASMRRQVFLEAPGLT